MPDTTEPVRAPGGAAPLRYPAAMDKAPWTEQELAAAIVARGLPEAVARIATQGGGEVHPSLEFSLESVWLDPAGAAMTALREFGTTEWLPLWQSSATSTVFALPDGSFEEWNAEAEERFERWADWPALVRFVLTDLYEAEAEEDERAEVAALLLPEPLRAAALVLEPRDDEQ